MEKQIKAMRMDKFLSQTLNVTRTEAKKMLKQERISKNEVVCKDGAEKVIPQTDVVSLDGTPIQYEQFHYMMLYKPAGCVTATEDAHAKTVMDYIPAERRRNLSPVGRLDKDTEGLLLLTDDGALNHRLLAPGKHVPKTYWRLEKRNRPLLQFWKFYIPQSSQRFVSRLQKANSIRSSACFMLSEWKCFI